MTTTQLLLLFVGALAGASLTSVILASRDFNRRFNTDANGIPKKPSAD